jgi:hypothetical protein
MRIKCITTFDITATGVRSNFNANRIPFNDNTGQLISDIESWTHSRNQQRNWETINQLISLRCLPHSITDPSRDLHDGIATWRFDFEVEDPATISLQEYDLALLQQDCQGIPMITGLGETKSQLHFLDPGHNILFDVDFQ